MTAQHAPTHVRESNRRLGDVAAKVIGPAALLGVGGVVASIGLAMFSGEQSGGGWDRFFKSYLMAFTFILSICLGALFFVMLQHAVKAGWSVSIRRLAEGVASNLQWIWILFLPIAIAVAMDKTHLYHWMHPVSPDGTIDAVLVHKAPYFFWPLSYESHIPAFWLIRAALFFGIWAFLARFFVANSIAQDSTGDVKYTKRMEKFAPPAFILFALSLAFGGIDWVMSLEPHWFSTMFPVYFFAASCCGFFSLQILIANFLQRNGRLTAEITPEHYQDAGKLLFAFGIVFWAYIAFSQYMLIWYANIPEETTWYMARQMGGWGWVSLLLLFGHFLGPFLILISRHPKRQRTALAMGAAWMLFMHLIDIYWLVMPKVPTAVKDYDTYRALADAVYANRLLGPGHQDFDPALDVGFQLSVLDATCVVGLFGLMILGAAWRLTGVSLIPQRDPRLHEALAFENI
jgi:hypothetical protein